MSPTGRGPGEEEEGAGDAAPEGEEIEEPEVKEEEQAVDQPAGDGKRRAPPPR